MSGEFGLKGIGMTNGNNLLFDNCSSRLGGMDASFLCQSIGGLVKEAPVMIGPTDSIDCAMKKLQEHRVGCLLVVESNGKLSGIFSERDYIKKVYGQLEGLTERWIEEVMTRHPMTITPEGSLAYALNLMAHGGFRHVPVVDDEDFPIGMISLRDITDVIVERMTGDIMALELEEE